MVLNSFSLLLVEHLNFIGASVILHLTCEVLLLVCFFSLSIFVCVHRCVSVSNKDAVLVSAVGVLMWE